MSHCDFTDHVRIGVVTVSDRASRGEYEDRGGPAVVDYLNEVLQTTFKIEQRVVSDDLPLIETALIELVDEAHCCWVITTGGTGPAPRDVTPEATMAVCDRLLPGFGEEMRRASLQYVATAILSRQLAGSRGRSLIINLPGQPKAIAQCLDAIMAAVPYCIDLLGGPRLETRPERLKAFRPIK
jgi:molybdopterin adenylyltransferase